MGLTITAIIIAVLAGIGAYYSWGSNKGLATGLAVVTLIAGAVGTIGAFVAALGLILKLVPFLLMLGGVWLLWKVVQSRRNNRNADRDVADVRY